MRTKAGDFNLNVDIPYAGWETSVTVTHNDPSGNVEIEYDYGSTVNIASGNGSGKYWANAWTDPVKFRFSTFTAYMTELELDGNIGVAISQVPPQLTSYKHTGGDLNHPLQMKGTSLPSGLTDLWLSDLRSPFDTDRVITALEENAQTNGTLFIAEQRLGKTTELLESRGWDVEIEPDIIHRVEHSTAPHTSIIDGKVVHHVDRRRGGDRRKQFEGRCIELNGSSEYATGPVWASPDIAISLWFKQPATASSATLIGSWVSASNKKQFILNSDASGPLRFLVQSGAGGGDVIAKTYTTAVDDDQWHHVYAEVVGSTMRLFLDGTEEAVSSTTGTLGSYSGSLYATDQPLRIGAAESAVANFAGKIKHPRIYDSALTDAQIAALAAEGPQLPLATGLPTPPIDLPMDDATSSPIIRNHGSLGQSGDFTLTGTPSSIWTTSDRVSMPNEHGCSVGLVTNGVDSYLDTQLTLGGATALTVYARRRYLSSSAYDFDGWEDSSTGYLRFGRFTGTGALCGDPGHFSAIVNTGAAIADGELVTMSMSAAAGGNTKFRLNGVEVLNAATTLTSVNNGVPNTYRIGLAIRQAGSFSHHSHSEIHEYLIADRVLTDDELLWLESYGVSGTPIDIEGDANILAYYDFQTPHPRIVHNAADPGNPGKIVGDCEWVAINHDAATPTQDMNGKALTWKGQVPRDSVISSPAVELNGTSEYFQSFNPVDLGGSQLTASAKFKTTDANGGYIFSLWDYNNNHRVFQLGIDASGKVTALISHDGTVSNYKFLTSVDAYNDGEWHVAELTFDAGTLKLFIDKVEQTDAVDNSVGTTTAVFSVSKAVTAGAVWNGAENRLSGEIADCKLATTAATDEEIYNDSWTPNVLHWPCCESSGDICWDISGNGNHGTGAPTARTGSQNASDVLITSGWGKITQLDGSSYLSGDATIGNAIGSKTQFSCFIRWYNTTDSNKGLFQMSSSFPSTASRVFSLHHQASGTQITVRFNNANFNVGVAGWSANAWNTIGVVYDGTNVYLWKNGVKSTVGAYSSSINFTGAKPQVGTYYNDTLMMTGAVERTVLEGAAWSDAEMEAMIAAATISDVAATRPDAYCILGDEEVLQGTGTLTAGGTPNVGPIPAGAGAPVAFGPGVPAPGQSRLIAPEPNSPFALRYAKDYQLDEGALAYEAVFGGGLSHVDLGSILIGATDDFDLSLDFIQTSGGGNASESLFSQYTSAVAGRLHLFVNDDNEIGVFIDGATDILMYSGDGTAAMNKWHTARLTRVGDVFTLYLNGQQVATQTQSGISVQQINTRLGEDDAALDEFNGRIRNVRIDNNGTVTEYLTQNIALPGATLTNVTVNSVNHGVVGGRQLFFNSDGTANLYETPMSAEMTEVIATNPKKYS